jgi:hypothetical protein
MTLIPERNWMIGFNVLGFDLALALNITLIALFLAVM